MFLTYLLNRWWVLVEVRSKVEIIMSVTKYPQKETNGGKNIFPLSRIFPFSSLISKPSYKVKLLDIDPKEIKTYIHTKTRMLMFTYNCPKLESS